MSGCPINLARNASGSGQAPKEEAVVNKARQQFERNLVTGARPVGGIVRHLELFHCSYIALNYGEVFPADNVPVDVCI